jgi:sulfur carrier protein
MSIGLTLQVNGKSQTIAGLSAPTPLPQVIAALALKSDRIAIEHNSQIVPRSTWDKVQISDGDRLEIVHFVGGGTLNH